MPTSYPVNVNASTLSATSVYVSWKAPPVSSHHGIIIAYGVEYRSIPWNRTNIIRVNGSKYSMTLMNLIPFTTYKIMLRAATIIGYGPTSPHKTAATLQAG